MMKTINPNSSSLWRSIVAISLREMSPVHKRSKRLANLQEPILAAKRRASQLAVAFRALIVQRSGIAHSSSRGARWLLCFALVMLTATVNALELPTAKPTTGTIHRWVALPSTLAPWQQATLYAKVTGYIKKIAVDKGDRVKSGQVLAEIEVPELEAELAKHKAESAALKPAFEFAQQEYDRLTKAQKASPALILPQMLEKVKSELDKAKAAFDVVEASAKQAEVMLGYAKITAPFDGVVTSRFVDAGALVTAGSGKVVDVVDASTVRLQIPVTEMETSLVTVGKPVKAQIDAAGAKPVEAQISRTGFALDPATRTMLAEADLKNPEGILHPGMYAMARIAVEKHDNVMLIPVDGLVMEKTNAFVFTLVDGKAKKLPVTVGFNDGTNVEIASGLEASVTVLLPGKVTLTPDQPVTAKP